MPNKTSNLTALVALAALLAYGTVYMLPKASTPVAVEAKAPASVQATTSPTQAAAVSESLAKAKPVATSTAVARTRRVVSATKPTVTPAPAAGEAVRVIDPYDTSPLPADTLNERARAATVNIFCTGNDTLRPTSGSGVIIDPRGIILTNAHVAQYVLLSEDPRIDLSCQIRTGSPAYPHYVAEVLYMPSAWVETHSKDILSQHPLGTGENDYALLSIVGTTSGAPLPNAFPYVSPDTREAIGFTSDRVLAASYPAEFLGGMTAQMDLYQVSSFTNIGELLTFGDSTVDAFSLGGIIGAQSGSSGGAVVNAWGRLVGVIATMSDATTTAQRDLRAVTLSYVNRDLKKNVGLSLSALLASDLAERQKTFDTETGPAFVQQFMAHIRH